MAVTRRQEGGEEEDSDKREDFEPGVRRDDRLHGAVRAHPADEPHRQRHGLRPRRAQRTDRATGARHEERANGTQALERNVRQVEDGRD